MMYLGVQVVLISMFERIPAIDKGHHLIFMGSKLNL